HDLPRSSHRTYFSAFSSFFLSSSLALLPLHSFPTRRSSDLIFRRDIADIRPFHTNNSRIIAQFPVQLSMADINRIHLGGAVLQQDRKSTRLNSSHVSISYAVFCLKKKNKK